MPSLSDRARDLALDGARTILCGAGGLQRAVNDFNEKRTPFYSGSRGEAVTRRIESELLRFCPVPPPVVPPTGPPPFTGGQCQVPYNIFWSATHKDRFSCEDVPASGAVFGVPGPVTSVNLGSPVSDFICEPGTQGFFQIQASWSGVSGGNIGSPPSNTRWVSLESFQVARADGLPDDCGDPPGEPNPQPPPASPNPPPTTEPIEFSPEITVPVVFTPIIGLIYADIDGSLNVPVTVNANFDLGGQNFDIDFDFNIDLTDPDSPPTPPPEPFPDNPDGRPNPPNCPPPAPCAPDPEDEEPEEEPIDPEDPEDKAELEVKAVIIKSIVDVEATTATEILWPGNDPNIWVPRIASIKFVYYLGPGQATWSTDIDVKATDVIIPAPQCGVRCVGAVVSPGRGVASETFFIYGRVESLVKCT